jgi:hypothetical protein
VVTTRDGATVYFDWGFVAQRPRVHDLGYALAWMLRENLIVAPDVLLQIYEESSGIRLAAVEHHALPQFVAAVPLYFAAISGYTTDPVRHLLDHMGFVTLANRILNAPHLFGHA